jgi:hypothetical protein
MARGSRKHVLDWTSTPTFRVDVLKMIAPVPARLSAGSTWMPRGHESSDEARLETFGPAILPDNSAWFELRSWWLAHARGANTPNWDIAVSCEIDGRPGLVLVEAKAHVQELSEAGKAISPGASPASRANHERIQRALNEACAALRAIDERVTLGVASHYQFANRVAFAWKLAALGIPTVLVYLGFTGDDGIRDIGEPFRDHLHWTQTFAAHTSSIVPPDLFERRIECGSAATWFLVRSKPVTGLSNAAHQV